MNLVNLSVTQIPIDKQLSRFDFYILTGSTVTKLSPSYHKIIDKKLRLQNFYQIWYDSTDDLWLGISEAWVDMQENNEYLPQMSLGPILNISDILYLIN